MNSETLIQKITVGKAKFWVRVFVVSIIFSITSFLILLDMSKEYRASVSLLVSAKSETSATQLESIVSNVAEFPRMLSFYERLLKNNSSLRDEFVGKSQDERKRLWNDKIEISTSESSKGSIITLSVFANSSHQAEILVGKTAQNLIEISGRYYNVGSETDMGIVDGPFVSPVSRKIPTIILLSLLIGFSFSILLNSILGTLEKVAMVSKIGRDIFKKSVFDKIGRGKKHQENLSPTNEYEYPYEIPYDIPYDFNVLEKGKTDLPYEDAPVITENDVENIFKENPYPNYPEMPVAPKQALAPANLPVADFESHKEKTQIEEKESFIEMKGSEPTEDELKARLNQLLRGGQ